MMENNYSPPKAAVADVSHSSGEVTAGIIEQLRRTKPWALFVAIVVFIMAVLLVLTTAMVLLGAVAMNSMDKSAQMGGLFLGLGLFLGIAAVVYFLLGMFLTKFTSAVDLLVGSAAEVDLINAMARQQRFWVIATIVLILTVVITLVYDIALLTVPELKSLLSGGGA
jgi:hypothetical protein